MPKFMQVRTPISHHGFAVPADRDLMGRDAGDRARTSGLIAVFADPSDVVA
jgi:hypothetical protein